MLSAASSVQSRSVSRRSAVSTLASQARGLTLGSSAASTLAAFKGSLVDGYLQSQQPNSDNTNKVNQLTNGTTSNAFKSAITQEKIQAFLVQYHQHGLFKYLIAPTMGTLEGTDVVVSSLSNDTNGSPPDQNYARLDDMSGGFLVPVTNDAHTRYLNTLDGSDPVFPAPTEITVGAGHVLHGAIPDGIYHVYSFPKSFPLLNGSTPCQGTADESMLCGLEGSSNMGTQLSFWATESSTFDAPVFDALQTLLTDNREALGIPKFKNGRPQDQTSPLVTLMGISAAELPLLASATMGITERFASSATYRIPRKINTHSTIDELSEGATTAVSTGGLMSSAKQLHITKHQALGLFWKVNDDGSYSYIQPSLTAEMTEFVTAPTNAAKQSGFEPIRSSINDGDGMDMLSLNATCGYFSNIQVNNLATAEFAQSPAKVKGDLFSPKTLRVQHFAPRAPGSSNEDERRDQERNQQQKQGEVGENMTKVSTMLGSITSITKTTATGGICTLLAIFGRGRADERPDGYSDMSSTLGPLIATVLRPAFDNACLETASEFRGTYHAVGTMWDRLVSHYCEFALNPHNLKCWQSGDYDLVDSSKLDAFRAYAVEAKAQLQSFVVNCQELPKSVFYLHSVEKLLWEKKKRELLRQEILAAMPPPPPPRADLKRKSPPAAHADGERPPARAPRNDTAGDICVQEGVRRLELPPRGSLSSNPCAANLRAGFYCRFGSSCRNDHTRINQLSVPDQKAWVRHVGTRPDLSFNTDRVSARIVSMPLSEAAARE